MTLIVADKSGQLGNRLFVFAHCVATAIEEGFRVANPAFDEFAGRFPSTADDILCRYPVRGSVLSTPVLRGPAYLCVRALTSLLWLLRLRSTPWWKIIRLDWNQRCDLSSQDIASMAARRAVLVQGWLFRNNGAFVRQAPALREFFRPARDIEVQARSLLDDLRRGADVVIGVHIRLGDYRRHLGGRFYFKVGQYLDLMQRMQDLFPDRTVTFLVASDQGQDAAWFSRLDVHLSPGDALTDLHALAGCDYILGPPSSFTLWASFFGEVPLYPVVEPLRRFDLTSFAVVPTVLDDEVRELYGIDAR